MHVTNNTITLWIRKRFPLRPIEIGKIFFIIVTLFGSILGGCFNYKMRVITSTLFTTYCQVHMRKTKHNIKKYKTDPRWSSQCKGQFMYKNVVSDEKCTFLTYFSWKQHLLSVWVVKRFFVVVGWSWITLILSHSTHKTVTLFNASFPFFTPAMIRMPFFLFQKIVHLIVFRWLPITFFNGQLQQFHQILPTLNFWYLYSQFIINFPRY